MEQLQKIATPSTFTCPECQGTLWELTDQQPQRFRCHTGHSFTAPILGELQHEKAEDAIWAAVRALQEKEQLFLSLAAKAAGDEATATTKLGRAVALAAETGNDEATAKLRKVVDIEDADTGTVRLKRGIDKLDEMALDTASTKTTRVKR